MQVVAVCDVHKERRENAAKRIDDQYAKDKKDGEAKKADKITDLSALDRAFIFV